MSDAVRENLAVKLQFADAAGRNDILDPAMTDTWLVALLQDLSNRCVDPILVTSVRSDHADDSALGEHGHARGWAADLWIADWKSVGDARITDLLIAIAACPYVWTVGLGGMAREYDTPTSAIAWPVDGKFVVFDDNDQDHVHVQAGNGAGEGKRT